MVLKKFVVVVCRCWYVRTPKSKAAATAAAKAAAPSSSNKLGGESRGKNAAGGGAKTKGPEGPQGFKADLDLGGSVPLSLDGRASRTLKRLQEAISLFEDQLNGLDLADKPLQAGSLKEYKAFVQERVSSLTTWMKPAKEDIKKVERSTNKEAFAEQLDILQNLVNLASCLQKLLGMLPMPRPDPEEFLKLLEEFDACNTLGLGLGPGFVMKGLLAQANESCMHGDFTNFCKSLMESTSEVQQLLQGMNAEQVRLSFATEVENRLLSSMRSITAEELQAKAAGKTSQADTPNLHEASSLALAISSAGEDFVARMISNNAEMAYALLHQHDIASLEKHVQTIQSYAAEKAEKVSGMVRFFLQHEVGKALLAMAIERVEHGEAEAAFQACCEVMSSALGELEKEEEASRERQTSCGIAALKEKVSPAATALTELQGCSYLNSKGKKKDGSAAQCPIVIDSKKRLSKAAVSLVTVELGASLVEHLCLGLFSLQFTSIRLL